MRKKTMWRLFCTLLLAVCLCGSISVMAAAKTKSETSGDAIDLSDATVTLPYDTCTYNGNERRPNPTVTLDGIRLKKNRDYTLTFKNNIEVGTATVTITGTGSYTGTVSASYTIKARSLAAASADTQVELEYTTLTYTGKALKPGVTLVTVTLSGEEVTLKEGTDYTVSYSNNKSVGKATVKINGTGNFKGTVKATFKIRPKAVKSVSLSAASKGFTAEWKTTSKQVTGYEIQYATNASFTKGKGTVTVTGKSTDTGAVSGLTGNKKYYVRVRAYKTVDGKNYYSKWTSAKTVTTGKKVTVFAGDSIMSGMSSSSYNGVKYVDISGTEKVVAYTSLNTITFQTKEVSGGMTALEKAVSYKPYRLYIMLGTNEVEWRSLSDTIEYYEEIIDTIQYESPTTDIVILAVPPVSSSIATSRTGFRRISKLNAKLEALAAEYGAKYYDFTASFKNDSGYLSSSYNGGDGIHWNLAGYKLFAKVISEYDAQLESQ